MKKLMIIFGLGLIIGTVKVNRVEAQVHVSINIDIQPAWGPSGYNYAEYYYVPELNVYYDVINRLFHYRDGRRWISSPYLPALYAHYDFYSLYKVVLNDIRQPWKYNRRHRKIYAEYLHNYVQVPLFYMDERRYHRARDNYYGWVEPRYMPGNSGRPSSREFSKNTRNGRVGGDYRTPANNQGSGTVSNRSSSAAKSRSNAPTGSSSRSSSSKKADRSTENSRQGRR
ncbi:MAG: hypothetical protein LBJ47_03715 [Tannerella sp.]|jgi:hypothetical protein|nr:hypothetical protein [Tannerella sp.]